MTSSVLYFCPHMMTHVPRTQVFVIVIAEINVFSHNTLYHLYFIIDSCMAQCIACALSIWLFKLLSFFACEYNGFFLMHLLDPMQMHESMLSWGTGQFILICDFPNTCYTARVFHMYASSFSGIKSVSETQLHLY